MTEASPTTVPSCPKSSLDDVQLESVLSPVMFREGPRPSLWTASPADAMPDLEVLHLGGDWQRLIAGLLAYPPHVTAKIGYVGVEGAPVAETEEGSGEPLASRSDPLRLSTGEELPESRLRSLELLPWEALGERCEGECFDYLLLADVLHHLAPAELPELFGKLLQWARPGAFLVVHDRFFGDFGQPLALEEYCPEGVFFSPRHLASFFALAASDLGLYRTFPRRSSAGRWWLFTSVLRVGETPGGLGRQAQEIFTHEHMPAGIALSLEEMLETALKLPNPEWRDAYVERLAEALEEVRERWHMQLQDPVPRFAARRWLGEARKS